MTLRWEAFPTDANLQNDEQGLLVQASDITYELVIFKGPELTPVVERIGIREIE